MAEFRDGETRAGGESSPAHKKEIALAVLLML